MMMVTTGAHWDISPKNVLSEILKCLHKYKYKIFLKEPLTQINHYYRLLEILKKFSNPYVRIFYTYVVCYYQPYLFVNTKSITTMKSIPDLFWTTASVCSDRQQQGFSNGLYFKIFSRQAVTTMILAGSKIRMGPCFLVKMFGLKDQTQAMSS